MELQWQAFGVGLAIVSLLELAVAVSLLVVGLTRVRALSPQAGGLIAVGAGVELLALLICCARAYPGIGPGDVSAETPLVIANVVSLAQPLLRAVALAFVVAGVLVLVRPRAGARGE